MLYALGDIMYNLQNNPILLPHQIKLLQTFFSTDFSKTFCLTGGTALAAFYFGHRDSKDLDFFSHQNFNSQVLSNVIDKLAQATNSSISTKVKTDNYNEIYLENKTEEWIQRIDIVEDIPKRFGEILKIDGIKVDSLENIGSNKILTVFNRTEPKDFIDLYFILHNSKLTFQYLFELAKQKDLGLSEFYLANSITQIENIHTWPTMRQPLDVISLVGYYRNLVHTLYDQINPETH